MKQWFRFLGRLDWIILIVPMLLTGVGLVMIYSLAIAQNHLELFWSQLSYAGTAIVVFIVALWVDYRSLKQASPLLYLGTLLLLGIVLVVGQRTLGATRWIDLGPFQLQPAELMKPVLMLVVARILSEQLGKPSWKRFFAVLLLAALPIGLVLVQPDLGTSVVLAGITAALLLASRLSGRQLIASVLIAIAVVLGGWFSLKDYQRIRVEVFLNQNQETDSQGSSYNVRQSVIAVGSGGLTGEGIGRGSQSQLNFLPIAHTDFMFATIAEATGLLGAIIMLGLYTLLIWRIWQLTTIVADAFAMLVAVGVGSMLLIQVLVNAGMNIGLLPVTGIPLPFVSHGGSSLVSAAFLIGLLEGMYLRRKKIQFHF